MNHSQTTTLPPAMERLLRALIERVGVDGTAKALSLTRIVVTHALAGFEVRLATAKRIEQGLEALRVDPEKKASLARAEARYRPMAVFLRQRCEVLPGASVGALLLFQAWERWCDAHGIPARAWAVFEQRIQEAAPGVRAVRISPTVKRAMSFTGIHLKP
jgi:hypothetical protein